jgi:hypothetical protein
MESIWNQHGVSQEEIGGWNSYFRVYEVVIFPETFDI